MNQRQITKDVTIEQRARRPQENLSIARTDQVLKLHRRRLAVESNEDVIRMLDRERAEMAKESQKGRRATR